MREAEAPDQLQLGHPIVADQNFLSAQVSFFGRHDAKVDDKGRVVIPVKMRSVLGEGDCVVFLNENCSLSVYTPSDWASLFVRYRDMDRLNPAWQEITRFILGYSLSGVKVDAQGRILIPPKMRAEAKLTGDLVIVGCLDRCEIWNQAEYEKYEANSDEYQTARRERYARMWRKVNGGE